MKVLFLCKSNVIRSQIAEAFYNKFSNSNDASSAGLNVEEEWKGQKVRGSKKTIECMKEIGIDISENISKGITEEMTQSVDKVIVIGEKDNWPNYLKEEEVEFWDISDPGGKDIEVRRKVRDQIKQKVKELLG